MKKIFSLLLALTLVFALGASAFAGNPTDGETELTATVAETYVIIVPDDTTIAFEDTSTSVGDIGLSEAQLGPDRQVTLTADLSSAGVGALIHENGTDQLAYVMKIDGVGGNAVSFSAVGDKPVTIEIDADDWANAKAGEYSSTITFTVTCTDIT